MKKARRPTFRILRLLAVALMCLAGVLWLHHDSGRRNKDDKGNVAELRKQCKGRSIYIYDIPSKFNTDLMKNCSVMPGGKELCTELENDSLGLPYAAQKTILPDISSWFDTGVHSLEHLVHQRLRRHPCLTNDPMKAQLFYIPFYASMDFEQRKNLPAAERDALTLQLLAWLKKQPTFARQGGLDHFMTIGQASYNFARGQAKSDWGTVMLQLPEFRKVLKLEIEPIGALGHSFGIPFPTDFHPMTYKKLRQYQAMVNSRRRPYLWGLLWNANGSYAEESNIARTVAMKQCKASNKCLLLDCRQGCTHAQRMELWLNVQYAVQDGGSSGLRHTFDAMIAGAVPIMLWEMAFALYKNYLPTTQTLSLIHGDEYSLFLPHYDLPEWTPVEYRIARVTPKRYLQLKRKIISMMPSLLYFHHDNLIHGVEDAFLVAMRNVFAHLAKVSEDFDESDEEADARREATLKMVTEQEAAAEKAQAADKSQGGDDEPEEGAASTAAAVSKMDKDGSSPFPGVKGKAEDDLEDDEEDEELETGPAAAKAAMKAR